MIFTEPPTFLRMNRKENREKTLIDLFLVFSAVITIAAIAGKMVVFGSRPGNWVYTYFAGVSLRPFIYALSILPFIFLGMRTTGKYIDKREGNVVLMWLLLGFCAQMLLVGLRPASLSEIVACPIACSHYNPTQKYPLMYFLANFHSIVDSGKLGLHASTNMPGKVLFFYFLQLFTRSTQAMGVMIAFISSLGGVLTYLTARRLFADRMIAVYSMVFYMFIPAKIFVFPLLNTVTPVFGLLPMLLLVEYLATKKGLYALSLGAALYLLFIFEPLPLVTGLIALALIGRSLYIKETAPGDIFRMIVFTLVSFGVTHAVVFGLFGLDVFRAFSFIMSDMARSHIDLGRTYHIWILENLRNFFFNAGITQSLIFFIFLAKVLSSVREKGVLLLGDAAPLLAVSLAAVLLMLDISGVIRAEVTRIWIFFMVYMQMIAAYFCAREATRATFYIMITAMIFQAAVTMSMVGFVMPFRS